MKASKSAKAKYAGARDYIQVRSTEIYGSASALSDLVGISRQLMLLRTKEACVKDRLHLWFEAVLFLPDGYLKQFADGANPEPPNNITQDEIEKCLFLLYATSHTKTLGAWEQADRLYRDKLRISGLERDLKKIRDARKSLLGT